METAHTGTPCRIDDPHESVTNQFGAQLLAHDTAIRSGFMEDGGNERLRGAVHLGDEVALVLDPPSFGAGRAGHATEVGGGPAGSEPGRVQ